MLDSMVLRRLADLDTRPHTTLSLYLALDQPRDARLLSLGQMCKRKEQQWLEEGSAEAWKTLAADQDKMARFVEELPAGPHRGLALFSCLARDLFEAFTLPVSVPSLLELGTSPYIRPLTALAGDHCRTLTVLLDRRRARFFEGFLGLVRELPDLEIANPAQPPARDGDQGRAGDSGLSRRADEALGHYYKQIAQRLRDQCAARKCQQLLVGGSRVRVENFLPSLHPYLAQNLAGTIACDINANVSQVAEEVAQAQALASRQRQERCLANLADNLGPGGQAATGLNQVLAALHDGQVHTLLVRRGFTQAGCSCPSCGRLRAEAGDCPLCGAAMTKVDDVVNLALTRAMDSGAALEQVEGASALDQMGGIAALLRYA
jgi:peptide chain release factor subunit 1